MTDLQCTINTLDRKLLKEFRDYLTRVGVQPTVDYTIHNGVPFYLIKTTDNNSYVCTKAQWHYFALLLNCNNIVNNPTAFRVYPPMQILGHKNKWRYTNVQYTHIAKAHDTPLLDLTLLPIH